MAIDYSDERFAQVQAEKEGALNQVNNTYDSMINSNDNFYNDLKQATADYETKQTELQKAQTEQTIKEINQNKEKAEKDYIKEQKGAYADYAKQVDPYGVNSEKMASMGLTGSGYSESSKVSMYNTYQNRYAIARETYTQAVTNYDNQIAQAEIANSSKLAEIAYNSLQMQLEYALEGFQNKNSLLINKINAQQTVDNNYYNRYQDIVNQINTENSLAEQIRQYNTSLAEEQRQYNESMEYQRERAAVSDSQWQKEYELSLKKASASGSSSSRSGSTKTSSSGGSTATTFGGNDDENQTNNIVSSSVNEKILNTLDAMQEQSASVNDKANYINALYKTGKIDDSQLEELGKKYLGG